LAIDPHGETEYQSLNRFVAYYILAFRNSIGDLATPEYNYWITMKKHANNAQFMIYTIWFFWFVNVITFTILLLNFLIAVIS